MTRQLPDFHWTAETWKSYRYIDEGWDHAMVILDDQLVFRFPLDAEYKGLMASERAFLEYLHDKVAINIPRYTYVSSQGDFAAQLANFLSVLHTLPILGTPIQQVHAEYLSDDVAETRTASEKFLEQILSTEDYALVQEILRETEEVIKEDRPVTFNHNDIYPRHILWDQKAKKLGILDFSDMALGDPAIDFSENHDYGLDFVREVYALYTGPKDATFLDRAWTYDRWMGVNMMTDHFNGHKTSFELARETFDRIKQASHTD